MKKVNLSRFDDLVETAERINSRLPMKRFYSIKAKEGKILVFGMYDYKTKKHIISRPFEDLNTVFDEIDKMLINT